ncbi:kinase-like protein [Trametopsis cervina]|nr:kinase-like protein [Trametopsis cervina]
MWKRIRSYYDEHGTLLVLKSVDNELLESAGNALFARMEIRALQCLLAISSSRNHTIPAEIISCSKTTIIVMPWLREVTLLPWHSLDTLTDLIWQVLEGLEFMHENGVAHFDIHLDNLVFCSTPPLPTSPFPVEESKCYLIDFGSSKQLPRPPRGDHGDICFPYLPYGGHYNPPEGRDSVNPYAYDIYSTGRTAQNACEIASFYALNLPVKGRVRVPPALWEFCEMLSNKDPKMRPTASQSIMLLRIAWRWNKATQWLYWFAPYHIADTVNLFGWRYMIWLVYSMKRRKRMQRTVHQTRRGQVPYLYRLIFFTCSALLHSVLPLYLRP